MRHFWDTAWSYGPQMSAPARGEFSERSLTIQTLYALARDDESQLRVYTVSGALQCMAPYCALYTHIVLTHPTTHPALSAPGTPGASSDVSSAETYAVLYPLCARHLPPLALGRAEHAVDRHEVIHYETHCAYECANGTERFIFSTPSWGGFLWINKRI